MTDHCVMRDKSHYSLLMCVYVCGAAGCPAVDVTDGQTDRAE